MEEQIAVFESIAENDQVEMLREVACHYDHFQEDIERMVQHYEERDLLALTRLTLRYVTDEKKAFLDKLLWQRNEKMVQRLKPLFDEGKVFVAVGAMHLPGEKGMPKSACEWALAAFGGPDYEADEDPENWGYVIFRNWGCKVGDLTVLVRWYELTGDERYVRLGRNGLRLILAGCPQRDSAFHNEFAMWYHHTILFLKLADEFGMIDDDHCVLVW